MSQICGHCGTEVEDEALFCPACGQPLAAEPAPELPPAPDWPDAPLGSAPVQTMTPEEAHAAWAQGQDSPPTSHEAVPEERDAAEARRAADFEPEPAPTAASTSTASEVPPWRRGVAARNPQPPPEDAPLAGASGMHDAAGATGPQSAAGATGSTQAGPRPAGIVKVPAALSGWLIGVGSLVGALALFLPWVQGVGYTQLWGLASSPNIVILILLLAIGASIFFADLVPEFGHRSLAILAVTLIGVGIGLDAVARPASATGALIFLVALVAAAAGALLPEFGLDRPVGGPQA
jgi:hypothetical protein